MAILLRMKVEQYEWYLYDASESMDSGSGAFGNAAKPGVYR